MGSDPPAPDPVVRACGSCTLCCKIMGVRFDDGWMKPQGAWCPDCRIASGCARYETRPVTCHEFSCAWLLGLGTEDMRPDRTGAVLVAGVGDAAVWGRQVPVLTVHVDEKTPYRWQRGPLKRYIDGLLERGGVLVVVAGTKRQVVTRDPKIAERMAQVTAS